MVIFLRYMSGVSRARLYVSYGISAGRRPVSSCRRSVKLVSTHVEVTLHVSITIKYVHSYYIHIAIVLYKINTYMLLLYGYG
jgi:hypothetical protein